MSSLPLLLSLLNELEESQSVPSYYGDDFGLGIHPHHIHRQPSIQQRPSTIRVPLGVLARLGDRQLSSRPDNKLLNIGKDGFQVCMDVAQFKPSELCVKIADDSVVIEGKHEEREDDHGFISRHFVRRYALPKGYDANKLVSTLSSDGVLTVSIPKPKSDEKSSERVIQIQQTGPAHLNVKENPQEKKEENGEK